MMFIYFFFFAVLRDETQGLIHVAHTAEPNPWPSNSDTGNKSCTGKPFTHSICLFGPWAMFPKNTLLVLCNTEALNECGKNTG